MLRVLLFSPLVMAVVGLLALMVLSPPWRLL